MKAETITLTPNGRLTEHIAHVDVQGEVPKMSYRNGSGRIVSFIPQKLVITYQWSWSRETWHVLEVKALGRNGNQGLEAKFSKPERAPEWVRDAVKMATPALEIHKEGTE
ncbi:MULTISPECIES: hypothetical protein [unclassified Nonomuraea]|uniref:hypothetical protein n=1 Tax=unclassified Nonomuraea TaxID=2593643 RepID=UPI0033CCF76C